VTGDHPRTNCPYCGEAVSCHFHFCPWCGLALLPLPRAEQITFDLSGLTEFDPQEHVN
jgi:hypothetical protein